MRKVRTRFAPSPTGRMHVGNLRTALYAYLIAKHEGGDFILRIEDTDQARFMEGALDIIYRTLEKTGLIHDEGPDKDGGYGPYVQSERNASGIYLTYAKQLVEQGDAYYCFCDKARLDSLKNSVSEDGTDTLGYDKHCTRGVFSTIFQVNMKFRGNFLFEFCKRIVLLFHHKTSLSIINKIGFRYHIYKG